MKEHILFVCTTCASVWEKGKRVGQSGGEKFLERLQTLYDRAELQHRFSLQAVECMSACDRSCTFSLAAPGKYSYLFGDIDANTETLEEISSAVIECAVQYSDKPDGLLPWSERPKPLKKGIVAKIPPV